METLFDVKTAGWADWVMPKAKQLIADGAVTILANYPEYINAHVVGWGSDNDPKGTPDEHEVEIQRDDPTNPLAVSMWSCDCMWGQKSWGRTRKWQKYNGRMCSHALATLWRSMSTPQDLSGMEPGYTAPPGQARPTEPGKMAPTWEQQQMGIPGLEETGPQVTGPSESEIAIPEKPFEQKTPVAVPKFPQRQQLYLWDLTAQPGQETPAEFAPIPPEQRTQTLQMPGAFSSVQSKENFYVGGLDNGEQPVIMSSEIPRFKLVHGDFSFEAADDFAIQVQRLLDAGRTPVVQLLRPTELEQRGGKHPMPGAQPFDINSENTPIYNVMDLGYDPVSGGRVNADESTAVGPGAPETREAPEYLGGSQLCPAGKRGIILSLMPALKWAFISVPLQESPGLHPHSLEGYVSYRDLKLLPEAQDPYRAKY